MQYQIATFLNFPPSWQENAYTYTFSCSLPAYILPMLIYTDKTIDFLNYANFALATSTNFAKPSASDTANSASIFLFISTPASFNPYMNLL